MKKWNVLWLMFLACTGQAQQIELSSRSKQSEKWANTITESELKDHLYTYASDAFEGRETGTKGQKIAVEYLKAHYKSLQIAPAQANGDYEQDIELVLKKLPKGQLTFQGQSLENGTGIMAYAAFEFSKTPVVYVGYGVNTPEHNDYQGLDVRGKIVMAKAGAPMLPALADGSTSDWAKQSEGLERKQKAAFEQGAVGFIYWDEAAFARLKRRFDYMKQNDSGRMSIKALESQANAMIYVDQATALLLHPSIGESADAASLGTVEAGIKSEDVSIDSENVVAFIPGSEFPEQYVVISSHLDHVGVLADGSVNNGADDDGSGSVALLEIAEAFKLASDAGQGPRRSVVFLHVTGEEKGLLGSQYYTDVAPVFPLNKTIANLNIDMIGRIDPERKGDRNYVYLIGSDKLSTELHDLSEAVNKKFMGIELDYTYNDENDPNRFYYRSDHYNFAKNNIPIIFYFNGIHEDYHKPSDTPDKINYDLLTNRTRLVFHTAWEVANRDKAIVADKAQ
ncbi:MAG: M28 family peptidase [Flavobacteriaceae bacterium]